jgi:hypothetical protein
MASVATQFAADFNDLSLGRSGLEPILRCWSGSVEIYAIEFIWQIYMTLLKASKMLWGT